MPPAAFLAVAGVLKAGSEKYGDRNWRLITVREHLNHALTHAYRYLSGDTAEPHLSHAACRLMMALEIELVGMDKPEGFPRPPVRPDSYASNCPCPKCSEYRAACRDADAVG
jgi:hypothetical protein